MDHALISSIIQGILVGGFFGACFIKISNLRDSFKYFSETRFTFLYDDVSRLKSDKYTTITREELAGHVHYLSQRILVIETKMKERERVEENS